MKELKITWNELKKELDKADCAYRQGLSKQELSKEQKEFLRSCRGSNNVVYFRQMAILWKQLGWGRTTETSLRREWEKLKAEE